MDGNNSYQNNNYQEGDSQDSAYPDGNYPNGNDTGNNYYDNNRQGNDYSNNGYYQDSGYQNNDYPNNSYQGNGDYQDNRYQNFNSNQGYNPYQPYQQGYPMPPDPQLELEEPVSLGEWMLSFLIMIIPCAGIIMMFVWAFSKTEKKSKSNFFKAALIWTGIISVLYFLIIFVIAASVIVSGGW